MAQSDPDCAEAWHLLGVVALQRGDGAAAQRAIARAVELEPTNANYRTNLAKSAIVQGAPDDAEPILRAAIAADPAYADAHYTLGTVLRDTGRPKEAEGAFREAIELDPQHAQALNDLGAMLKNRNELDEAVVLLRRARDLDPADWGTLWNLASALELLNRLDEAADATTRLMALRPEDPVALLMAARLARRRGDPAAASAHAERARARARDDGVRLNACFELGLALERTDRSADAFAAFAEGNRLQADSPAGRRIDRAAYPARVAANRDWFDAERLARAPVAEPDGPAPIFFVGFPRSGTTLFEQVLAAHPDIVTTDEVSPLARLRTGLEAEAAAAGSTYPEILDRMDAAAWRDGRGRFWAEAENIVGGSLGGRFMVDKLPLNIVELGLANHFFPDAKVIVALRDPRDVCLSCFMQQFRLNTAMIHFTDLAATAALYAQVMDLWRHYRAHMRAAWIEYRYEDLITDFETVTRRVLDFVGIPWSDAIEGYRDRARDRAISTPSYRDVAGPLTNRAIARWRRFETQLAPILPALQPFVEEFGY